MLEDLSHHQNFGTLNYFLKLAKLLKKYPNGTCTKENIYSYFHNTGIDGNTIFDGCLGFADLINLVSCTQNTVALNEQFHNCLNDFDEFSTRLIEFFFAYLKNDELTYSIFSNENLSYDLEYNSIKITNKAFGFKYSQFKQLLIDLKVLQPVSNEISSHYIISRKCIEVFQTNLYDEIKRRALSPEGLESILAMQAQYGEDAERFVLKYEQSRVGSTKNVIWVAKESVSEGYDIASFNSKNSLFHDRFIEVKSYSGKPSFYWSKNEVNIAKVRGENYFLYLVNREKITNNNYSPTIIKHPIKEVFNNENWQVESEKYYVEYSS